MVGLTNNSLVHAEVGPNSVSYIVTKRQPLIFKVLIISSISNIRLETDYTISYYDTNNMIPLHTVIGHCRVPGSYASRQKFHQNQFARAVHILVWGLYMFRRPALRSVHILPYSGVLGLCACRFSFLPNLHINCIHIFD